MINTQLQQTTNKTQQQLNYNNQTQKNAPNKNILNVHLDSI